MKYLTLILVLTAIGVLGQVPYETLTLASGVQVEGTIYRNTPKHVSVMKPYADKSNHYYEGDWADVQTIDLVTHKFVDVYEADGSKTEIYAKVLQWINENFTDNKEEIILEDDNSKNIIAYGWIRSSYRGNKVWCTVDIQVEDGMYTVKLRNMARTRWCFFRRPLSRMNRFGMAPVVLRDMREMVEGLNEFVLNF